MLMALGGFPEGSSRSALGLQTTGRLLRDGIKCVQGCWMLWRTRQAQGHPRTASGDRHDLPPPPPRRGPVTETSQESGSRRARVLLTEVGGVPRGPAGQAPVSHAATAPADGRVPTDTDAAQGRSWAPKTDAGYKRLGSNQKRAGPPPTPRGGQRVAVSVHGEVSNRAQGHEVQRQNCLLLGSSGSDSSKEGNGGRGGGVCVNRSAELAGLGRGTPTVLGNGPRTPRGGPRVCLPLASLARLALRVPGSPTSDGAT